jgi:hypothetical protein
MTAKTLVISSSGKNIRICVVRLNFNRFNGPFKSDRLCRGGIAAPLNVTVKISRHLCKDKQGRIRLTLAGKRV